MTEPPRYYAPGPSASFVAPRRRTWLLVALVAGGLVVALAGGAAAWFALRPAAATTSVGANSSTPPPTKALSPTALQACKAVQAAGTDGQADPNQMRQVAKIGSDALDTAIKNDSDALFAAAESGAADDPVVQLRVSGAASHLMADCYEGGYIKP